MTDFVTIQKFPLSSSATHYCLCIPLYLAHFNFEIIALETSQYTPFLKKNLSSPLSTPVTHYCLCIPLYLAHFNFEIIALETSQYTAFLKNPSLIIVCVPFWVDDISPLPKFS